jgi:hypothetical protein
VLRYFLILPRLRSIGVVAMLALVWAGGPAAAQDRSLEYAVKATYLYKFVPFVAWPPGALASPASPFNICIIGDTNFAVLVADAVTGQTLDQRAIAVRRVTTIAEESACQVLFIGADEPDVLSAALTAVRGKPVLTVTDAAPSGQHGVVNFVLAGDRVRFEIDLGQAARGGIAISSKLLSLAVAVQPATAARSP